MWRVLLFFVGAAACGRIGFQAEPGPDACVSGLACTPGDLTCWSGVSTCGTAACSLAQPLDQVACPGGTCVTGVCTGPASAPFPSPQGTTNAYFGVSVASDSGRILVGAVVTNRAYILEQQAGQWVVTATLTSAFGPAGSDFGAAVAIEGDLAVVGSRYSNGPGMPPTSGTGGAIVVYQRDITGAWNELAGVLGPDGGEFGNAIAISGGRVLVGAEYANTIANGSGTAYIVEGAGASWAVVAKLADVAGDRLGHAVQLSGDRAFVGSLYDPGPTSSETGAVRLWQRQNGLWALTQKLQPDDPRPDAFGQGFSVDGDRLAVGVPWFSDPDRGTGAVYIYEPDASGMWQTAGPIDPPLKQKDGNFGRGILLRGDRLFTTSIDWASMPSGAVTTSIFRVQPDGRWIENGRRVDPGGGDNGFAYGGIECDLQMANAGDQIVVGYPVRGYNAGAAPGAIVFEDVTGL